MLKTKLVKIATVVVFILSSSLQSTEVGKAFDKRLFSDDAKIVQEAIDEVADVNSKNNDGYTALMIAARHNRLETAKLLIKSGANLNAKNDWGKTPLMIAASNNSLETAKLLIESGADLNAKNESGFTYSKTALIIAASNNRLEIVKLLAEHYKHVEIIKLIKEYLEKRKKEVLCYLSNPEAQILPSNVANIINAYL